jgi:hypothetical protein
MTGGPLNGWSSFVAEHHLTLRREWEDRTTGLRYVYQRDRFVGGEKPPVVIYRLTWTR